MTAPRLQALGGHDAAAEALLERGGADVTFKDHVRTPCPAARRSAQSAQCAQGAARRDTRGARCAGRPHAAAPGRGVRQPGGHADAGGARRIHKSEEQCASLRRCLTSEAPLPRSAPDHRTSPPVQTGVTPFELASENGHVQVARFLTDNGGGALDTMSARLSARPMCSIAPSLPPR